jgi:hypothetical protein
MDSPGFESRSGQHIFLFSKTPKTALGPIQPHIHWVLGVSPGVKRPEREADNLPQSGAEVKSEWICTCTPHVCLHDVHVDFQFVETKKGWGRKA